MDKMKDHEIEKWTTEIPKFNTTVYQIPVYPSPVPFWGTLIIAVGTCIFLVCLFVCWCYFFCCRKRTKKRKVGVFTGAWALDTKQRLLQPDIKENNEVSNYGHIYFTLDYNLNEEKLHVGIQRIADLTRVGFIDPCSPYVKVRLSPSHKFQLSRVQPLTHNPEYEETFEFKMSLKEQEKAVIVFTVYDYQLFVRHKKMGQLKVPLKMIQLGHPLDLDLDLEEPSKTVEDVELGDVCLSIRYVPTKSELTVIVIEAKNLLKTHADYKDPFVRVTLISENKKKKKKKQTSAILTNGINPYFNETLLFSMPLNLIQNSSLRVVVYFRTSYGRKRAVGEALIGSENPGTGFRQWTDAMQNMGVAYAQWHALTSLID